ncbi:MAG: nuclear transport factor 2 family protein [Chitinophagaceae bacterium]|nr:nuclear transport factor 2 family protein [Chitinophagaceae bacterium]
MFDKSFVESKRSRWVLLPVLMFCCCNNHPAVVDTKSKKNIESSQDAVTAIKLEISKLDEEFKNGDSVSAATHYASNALSMPPGRLPVNSNEIVKMIGSAIRAGVKMKTNITDISCSEDLCVETGIYEMSANKWLEKGKYVTVWKRENDKWRIYREIWNSNDSEHEK